MCVYLHLAFSAQSVSRSVVGHCWHWDMQIVALNSLEIKRKWTSHWLRQNLAGKCRPLVDLLPGGQLVVDWSAIRSDINRSRDPASDRWLLPQPGRSQSDATAFPGPFGRNKCLASSAPQAERKQVQHNFLVIDVIETPGTKLPEKKTFF